MRNIGREEARRKVVGGEFRFKDVESNISYPFSKVSSQGQIEQPWRECGLGCAAPSSRVWLKNSRQPD